MTWQLASFLILGLGLMVGFAWYERSRPSARVLSLVAALAALAVVGRLAFAAFPNVKPTTDIVLIAGYSLGGAAGFAVGAITPVASNIFLGHGPWTPWQMAAWGLVGIGGALLARTTRGRELGRWSLAAACALAGLMFGVVMDTYQWTLAAEQDLATWLAVSASSLPYNVAHIVGNVGFCLLIGPGLVRALARFRRRFEVRWAPAAASAAVLLLLLAVPASASAASAASRAATWLERAQNTDGGFGSDRGGGSGQLFTGWASLGLAATGRNPRDVERRGRSPIDYIRRNARQIRDVGEIERTILVLRAAGLSPRDFAGQDFIARLKRKRRPDGSFSGFVSYTAFGILALHAAHASGVPKSVRWLLRQQNSDGGFGLTPQASSDVDITSASMQALATANDLPATAGFAVDYLRRVQNPDGGFGQTEGRSSNAQSTAYAVQGLVAFGRDPSRFRKGGRSPLGYLRSLQRQNGSVAYSRLSAQTPVWVTAQAAMAFARKPLPLATVPRERRMRSGSAGAAASSDTETPAVARPAGEKRAERKERAATRKKESRAPAPSTATAAEVRQAAVAADRVADSVVEPVRDPGPQWLGVAISLAAAALAAWAGAARRRQRESRGSATSVTTHSSATTP